MGGHFEEGEEEGEDRVAESPTLFSCRIDNAKVGGRDERREAPHSSLAPFNGRDSRLLPRCVCVRPFMQVVTATLACLSTGAKKDQLAQVEVNEDGACMRAPCVCGSMHLVPLRVPRAGRRARTN